MDCDGRFDDCGTKLDDFRQVRGKLDVVAALDYVYGVIAARTFLTINV